jgi:L-alanine-DL-glutamate epimerase-like enolase superfamily enzyme
MPIWQTEVERVRLMRDALGPYVDILLDATMAWTVDQVIFIGRKIEPYDVFRLEEPVNG